MDGWALLIITSVFLILIMVGGSFLLKRLSGGQLNFNNARFMKIIDKLTVGPDRYLLIVKIGTRVFFVSMTQQSVNLISELDADSFPKDEVQVNSNPPLTFQEIFKNIKNNRKK